MKTFNKKLKGILALKITFRNETGLLIRYPLAKAKIGGIDTMPMATKRKYVIDGVEREIEIPYVPGSSLKGRMRGLLEIYKGLELITLDERIFQHIVPATFKEKENVVFFLKHYREVINKLFGINAVQYQALKKAIEKHKVDNVNIDKVFEELAPTRLLVDDFYPTDTYVEALSKHKRSLGLPLLLDDFLEHKSENRIDRITSAADPRDIMRVRPGVEFGGTIKIIIYENDFEDTIKEYLKLVSLGLRLIEETYLGGSGSRGYGRIKFTNIEVSLKTRDYFEGKKGEVVLGIYKSVNDMLKDTDNIISKMMENAAS